MADEKADAPKKEKEKSPDDGKKPSLVKQLIICAIIMIVCGSAGAATGFFTAQPPTPPEDPDKINHEEEDLGQASSDRTQKECTYFPLDPITVNLNVAQVNRYLRVQLTLAIENELFDDASTMLKDKSLILTDRLRGFFAGLTLEEVSGEANLQRIKRDLRDLINAEFWPESKPCIDHVLLKDWAVQ